MRFNEAAAYHCGKLRAIEQILMAFRVASMRPQHITAENETPAIARWLGDHQLQ